MQIPPSPYSSGTGKWCLRDRSTAPPLPGDGHVIPEVGGSEMKGFPAGPRRLKAGAQVLARVGVCVPIPPRRRLQRGEGVVGGAGSPLLAAWQPYLSSR